MNIARENGRGKIVVIGGGFAGLSAAIVAADEIRAGGGVATVALVSDSDHITIRPRLYEKSPESLRAPLRPVLDPTGIAFVEGWVTAIDTEANTVSLKDGTMLTYDRLILATGSVMPTLPVAGVAKYTFSIDSYACAVAFDRHLQKVAKTPGAPGHGTYVIVGGGMTGIELAAEMRNRIAQHADAPTADAARVILVEIAGAIGPEFGDNPRPVIDAALDEARVERRLGCRVAGFDASFNPTYPDKSSNRNGWVSPWIFGLNQGPIVLMIENHESELIWKTVRKSARIARGLRRAGFRGGWLDEAALVTTVRC